MADLQDLLRRAYLFRNASPDDLHALARLVERHEFNGGQAIYKTGAQADALYIIESGTVEIIPDDRTEPFAVFSTGHLFGELGFFDPQPRLASANVRSTTVVFQLPYSGLRELLMEREAFSAMFYRDACRFMAGHLTNLASHVEQRYI